MIDLAPTELAGQKLRTILIDDASDTATAIRAARKLVEDGAVDVILGPSTTPTSLAVLDVAAASGTPMVTLAGCAACIEPMDDRRRWAFKLTPNDRPIMNVLAADMVRHHVKRLANIAFATSFGDAFVAAMDTSATSHGIDPVLTERYNPADTSVVPQALHVMAAKPDAVFIAGSGSPAATPILALRNRGYTGLIYSNPGAASRDVLRLGGAAADGLILATSPFFVAEQLPAADPVKPIALAFDQAYERRFGEGTRSQPAASMWDAFRLIGAALPAALETGQPGTPAFRAGLRQAMERARFIGAQGPFAMTPTDHSGSDEALLVLAQAKGGQWHLVGSAP